METKNIEIKGSKILVFGGVYSNFQALSALKSWAEENMYSPEQIICTGDVVGYCAEPQACVDLVSHWNIHCIAGNVEIQLRNGDLDCGCNFNEDSTCDIYSKQWYPFAQQHVDEVGVNWMKQLPDHLIVDFAGLKWGVIHGTSSETAQFVFKSNPWSDKQSSFDQLNVNHILAGHCGLPFHDSQFEHSWINSGAIGMPANDGTDRVWFCTIQDVGSHLQLEYHTLDYDMHETASFIRELHLPAVYAMTLLTGFWDSTDILNEEETKLTGIPIGLDQKAIHLSKEKIRLVG